MDLGGHSSVHSSLLEGDPASQPPSLPGGGHRDVSEISEPTEIQNHPTPPRLGETHRLRSANKMCAVLSLFSDCVLCGQ